MAEKSNTKTSPKVLQEKDGNLTPDLARWTIIFAFGGIAILGLCAISSAAAPGIIFVFT